MRIFGGAEGEGFWGVWFDAVGDEMGVSLAGTGLIPDLVLVARWEDGAVRCCLLCWVNGYEDIWTRSAFGEMDRRVRGSLVRDVEARIGWSSGEFASWHFELRDCF